MDLADFISTTLISIRQGIKTANAETQGNFKIFSEDKAIKFDIAVEIAKESTGEKGGKLKIHVAEVGIERNSKTTESAISRINFIVGLNTSIY
jgi:hypothetical protein